ncbi:MAG: Cytosolic Fe-S cluster assembly factor nubp1, partial [Paramarteilia canceri]
IKTASCPGVTSENAGKASLCNGCPNQKLCSSGEAGFEDPSIDVVFDKLKHLKFILFVMSGKGGVGKSTIACLLSHLLAENKELNIGLLDTDICGPSQSRMTNTLGESVFQSGDGWSPVFIDENLCTMSSSYLLDQIDKAIVWRGAKKTTLIKKFLADVDWNATDCLVIDTPPGTSDEHLTLVQLLSKLKEKVFTVIVTQPDVYSMDDVRRQLSFCRKTNLNILGIIENMAYFPCKSCGYHANIWSEFENSIENFANEERVNFLGKCSFNTEIQKVCDKGLNDISLLKENMGDFCLIFD